MGILLSAMARVLLRRGRPHFKVPRWEGSWIGQTLQFMIDMLPTIRELIKEWPGEKLLEVLDVGTGSGAGANLLGTLYRSSVFGVQMKVDALDITAAYKPFADHYFPNINYTVGDIIQLPPERKWDLVICSHIIEHFADPLPFIAEARRRARHWALFYAPYEEQHLGSGHLTSVTRSMIEGLNPGLVRIMSSPAWTHQVDEKAETVLFVLVNSDQL